MQLNIYKDPSSLGRALRKRTPKNLTVRRIKVKPHGVVRTVGLYRKMPRDTNRLYSTDIGQTISQSRSPTSQNYFGQRFYPCRNTPPQARILSEYYSVHHPQRDVEQRNNSHIAPPSSEARFLSKRQFVNFAGADRTSADSPVGDDVVRLRLVSDDSLHRVQRSFKRVTLLFVFVVGGGGQKEEK